MWSASSFPPVPATPAIEGVDVHTLYDLDHATLLGRGGFSEVVAVRHLPTGEQRALKVIRREILVGKKAEIVAHEKEILRRTHHPSIITLHETIQTPEYIYFSLDLMHEDLFEFIVRNKCVNESLSRRIMHAILSGINYLHEQSIVHRDIKPENILINVAWRVSDGASDSDGNDSTTALKVPAPNINEVDPNDVEVEVKLADFGLAKLVVEWDVRNTPCGTSFYIAPEIIRGIEDQGARPLCTNQQLVKAIDVWSAGVVLFVLLSGRPPFHGKVKTGEERRALLRAMGDGVLFSAHHGWFTISPEAKELVARMLEPDSAKRITAAEALRHPFFTAHGLPQPIPGHDLHHRRQQELARLQQLREAQEAQKQETPPSPEEATTFREEHFYSNGRSSLGRVSVSQSKKRNKKKGLFTNMKAFFTRGVSAKEDEATLLEQKEMQEELAALQKEVVLEEDKEGEETAYRPNMPVLQGKASRPAMMNNQVKVGPSVLKK